ncbi:MAG TPA: universal stress protein [Bacteroidales bacterium]|nr:universal stress protein [Bacteroidales bacterium]HPS16204.1 universal stress protein [Bacteroidales bacterium]
MKKEKEILVAIDFSKCSIKALEFAISIANYMDANIMMVYVDKPQSTESIYSKRGLEHQEKLVNKFEKLIKQFASSLNGKMEYKIRKGKVYIEISNQAKYSDSYLIVAGTHGVTGFEEFWIGSNAYRIVTSAPCPVITIREAFIWNKKHISKIILPIDSSIETRQKVPFTTELAKLFGAEIHVLGIHSTKVKDVIALMESYARQAMDYIRENNIPCHYKKIFSENITLGTIDYAKEIKAELIAVMSEQEGSTKNIWLGTYAQQMVNHSPVPVLIIHSKQIYDAQLKK